MRKDSNYIYNTETSKDINRIEVFSVTDEDSGQQILSKTSSGTENYISDEEILRLFSLGMVVVKNGESSNVIVGLSKKDGSDFTYIEALDSEGTPYYTADAIENLESIVPHEKYSSENKDSQTTLWYCFKNDNDDYYTLYKAHYKDENSKVTCSDVLEAINSGRLPCIIDDVDRYVYPISYIQMSDMGDDWFSIHFNEHYTSDPDDNHIVHHEWEAYVEDSEGEPEGESGGGGYYPPNA